MIDFETVEDLLDFVSEKEALFKNIIVKNDIAKKVISELVKEDYNFDIIDFSDFEDISVISMYDDNDFDVIPIEIAIEDGFEISDDELVLVQDGIIVDIDQDDFTYFTIGEQNCDITKSDDGHYISMSDTNTDSNGNVTMYSKSFYSTNKELVSLMAELWGA